MKITHTPPVKGYTISIAKDDNWLCSATSDESGTWSVEVTPELPSGYARALIIGDNENEVENTLALIAEGIYARIGPKGDDPKVREDFDRIIKVVRAVCSDKQLAVIHDALGAEKLDEATLAAIKQEVMGDTNRTDPSVRWRGEGIGLITVENPPNTD